MAAEGGSYGSERNKRRKEKERYSEKERLWVWGTEKRKQGQPRIGEKAAG